jgi:DNA-binding response OmpR family regulator
MNVEVEPGEPHMSALGRILVVDDEPEVLAVLREYLTGRGYAVTTAQSGADAISAMGRGRPDLVLLDLNMPGIDGVEVLRHAREHDPTIGVIMVTANQDLDLARRTLKLGAFDYIAKPFDFTHLERVVLTGMVSAGERAAGAGEDAKLESAFHQLAVAVFGAARAMADAARASIGERLEASALAALRHAAANEPREALRMLDDLRLLVRLAADLGDVSPSEQTAIESALSAARTSAGAPD